MKRLAIALTLVAFAAAGCGGSDIDTRERINDAQEELRTNGSKAVDRAEEALKQLENSDLPADARRELEEAKRLLEEAKP